MEFDRASSRPLLAAVSELFHLPPPRDFVLVCDELDERVMPHLFDLDERRVRPIAHEVMSTVDRDNWINFTTSYANVRTDSIVHWQSARAIDQHLGGMALAYLVEDADRLIDYREALPSLICCRHSAMLCGFDFTGPAYAWARHVGGKYGDMVRAAADTDKSITDYGLKTSWYGGTFHYTQIPW